MPLIINTFNNLYRMRFSSKILLLVMVFILATGWSDDNGSGRDDATEFRRGNLTVPGNYEAGESDNPDHGQTAGQSAGSWGPLRWTGRSPSTYGPGDAMVSKAETIVKIFQKAAPLNPPRGIGIDTRGEFLQRFPLPGNASGPEPVRLRLSFRIPPDEKEPAAGVDIWINEPFNLLGDPVLSDQTGDIFLLPPGAGELAGQPVRTRSAHPPGYEEKYPSMDLFPLWAIEQEPYLRSVVRPTFGLARATVTTMFTSGGRPFWIPVSQERWIMAMIKKANDELDEFQAGVEAAQTTEITRQQIDQMQDYLKRMRAMYDEKTIIERYAKLREEMMKTVQIAVSMNPGEEKKYYEHMIEPLDKQLELELASAPESLAKLREYEDKLLQALITREDVWTTADAAIRGGDWDRLEALGGEYDVDRLVLLADAGRARDKLQAELSSLSPAQRAAPAWGFELPPWHPLGPHRHVVAMPFEAVRPSGLVDPGTVGARALVSLDTGFFTFVEKNAPIHVLAVEWWGAHDTRYGPMQRTLLNDLWSSLDWNALRALIE